MWISCYKNCRKKQSYYDGILCDELAKYKHVKYKDFVISVKDINFQMRSKIRYDLLLKSQQYAKTIKHPIQTHLYETAYNYLQEMRTDVLKQFNNICIHGSYPELIIPKLKVQNSNIWVHSHLSNMETLQHKDIKILNP